MRCEIEEWSDFPGCVGFLDGSNINLSPDRIQLKEELANRLKLSLPAVSLSLRYTFVLR
jgi:hypothetical protein